MQVGIDGDIVFAGVRILRREIHDALPALADAFEVAGVRALVGEDEGVEEGGEGVDVVAVGSDGGVELAFDVLDVGGVAGIRLGAVDVVAEAARPGRRRTLPRRPTPPTRTATV